MNTRRIGLFLLPLLLATQLLAQPLAFPGAAGFGKNAEGARGGTNPDVYIVSKLSDDGTQGTLRHAINSVSGDNGRFIVFSVGGVILLDEGSPLEIESPYITIAGQTAPNGGICILGESIFVSAHDVIIRGIRSRASDYYYAQNNPTMNRDGIKVGKGTDATPTIKDIIIDHCSFSWGIDEIVSAYRSCRNVTYQHNLFSEPLYRSVHQDESTANYENDTHSKGPTIGPYAENITLYGNITAHADNRNPIIKATDQAEVINNISYNYGQRGIQLFETNGGQSLKVNVLSNIWLAGPDSNSDKNRVFHFSETRGENNSRIYLNNNVAHVGSAHLAHDEDPITEGFYTTKSGTVLSEVLESSEVFSGMASGDFAALTSAEDELDFLYNEVGARWPMRDAIDARIIAEVQNGTGSTRDVVYITPGTTPGNWINPVGTREVPDVDSSGDYKLPDYDTLGSGPATDADSDGIPDALESTYGSNPLADDDSDGYLNIEEYINGIIDGGSGGGDTTAPTVSITAPSDESTVSGTISVTATASDNVGVIGVQFKLDGSNLGAEDTTSPYSVSWDTSSAATGSHTLTAVARDAASNTTTSTVVDVTVSGGGSSQSLDAVHDSFVRQGDPTANFNSTGTIYVKNATTTSSFHRVGYVRFDGSSLAGTVSSGTLTFTIVDNGQGSGTTLDHSLYLVGTDSWDETTLTWNNRPSLGALIDTESITATIGQSITYTLNQAAIDQLNTSDYLSVALVSETDDVTIEYGDKNDGASAPSLDLVLAGDTTAPTVSLTAPADESTVSGTVSVTATASDNVGVVGVQFKLDGNDLGSEDTTAPYSVSWDTSSASVGSHTLTAVARDAASNTTTSTGVDVTINDTTAPTVSITAPADESTVSGTISVTATASDDVGVVGVQFKLDGNNLGTEDTTAPYSVSWDTSSASAGSHTLTAVARDAANNTTTSTVVDVTISGGSSNESLDAVHDSFVRQGDPTANFNSTGTIYVKNATTTSPFHRVGYVRFDGASLSSTVNSGTLTFTIVDNGQGSGTTLDHSLYLVGTNSWDETSLTWNNRPSLGALIDTESITATIGQSITFTLNQAAIDQLNTSDYLSVALVSETDDVTIEYGDKNDGASAPSLDLVLGGGDTTAPSVAITNPADAATVSGTVTITATASDDVGVVGVQFQLDGVDLGTEDTTAPYSVSWDTSTASTGSHALTAVARDAATNSTTSATVTVTVATASSAVIDTFETGNASAWTPATSVGTWAVATDDTEVYRQSDNTVSASQTVLGGTSWTDQMVEADVKPISHDGSNRFYGVLARYVDSSNYYYLVLRTGNTVELKKLVGGSASLLDSATFTVATGNWYTLRIEAVGSAIKGYVNGQLMVETTDTSFSTGSAGLITFFTEASFDDVIATPDVSGLNPFGDDFEDNNANDWTATSGTWTVTTDGSKVYRQSNTSGPGRSTVDSANWSDQIVQADLKAPSFSTSGWIGLMGRYQDTTNYYYVAFDNDSDVLSLKKLIGGVDTTLDSTSFTVGSGTWYDVRLKLLDTTLKVYVDGVLHLSATDSALNDGTVGLVTSQATLSADEVLVTAP